MMGQQAKGFHNSRVNSITSIPADIRSGGLVAYRFSGGSDNYLLGCDIITGTPYVKIPHDAPVSSVCLSPDGHFMVSACHNKTLYVFGLDWEYTYPEMVDWDDGALCLLKNFLIQQVPYSATLQGLVSPTSEQFQLALSKSGKPVWTEDDFSQLLSTLSYNGFGWLQPEVIKQKLLEMADNWVVSERPFEHEITIQNSPNFQSTSEKKEERGFLSRIFGKR